MTKVLHAADVHLGAGTGFAEYVPDGALKSLAANAMTQSFERLVDIALVQAVDLLIIAGDLFHRSANADDVKIARAEFARLHEAKIRVVLVLGNHDPKTAIDALGPLPENVHLVKTGTQVFHFETLNLFVAASTPNQNENTSLWFPPAPDASKTIAVLHTSLDRQDVRIFHPCDPKSLLALEYDYYALGHIHRRMDEGRLRFSGNLQAMTNRDDGARGANLLRLSEQGIHQEFLETSTIRVEKLEGETLDTLLAQTETKRQQFQDQAMIFDIEGCEAAHPFYKELRDAILAKHPHCDLFDPKHVAALNARPWPKA